MFKGGKSSITRIFGKPSGKRPLRISPMHLEGKSHRAAVTLALGSRWGLGLPSPLTSGASAETCLPQFLWHSLSESALSANKTAGTPPPLPQPYSHLLHLQITNHNARAQAKGKGRIHVPSQTSLQQSKRQTKGSQSQSRGGLCWQGWPHSCKA